MPKQPTVTGTNKHGKFKNRKAGRKFDLKTARGRIALRKAKESRSDLLPIKSLALGSLQERDMTNMEKVDQMQSGK